MSNYEHVLRTWHILVSLFIVVSIIAVLVVSAEEDSIIPSWIKNIASFWVNDEISDQEFIEALQFLVTNKILEIPHDDSKRFEELEKENESLKSKVARLETEMTIKEEKQKEPTVTESEGGFSSLSCKRQFSHVTMTGRFTNGPDPISFLVVTLAVEDSSGTIVATGSGNIENLAPYETKFFDASAYYEGPYANCYVEVDYYYD